MKLKILLPLFTVLLAFSCNHQDKPLIIFDTDLGGDADDIAALSMLNHYQNKEMCELLAVMCWSTEEYAVPAIDAVNRFLGNPGIPIGTRKQGTHRDPNNYSKAVADQFEYEKTAESVPDATKLYREILAAADDKSITILTVGPLYNIKALIESLPDEISPLDGNTLITNKVKEFVVMGGQFPEGENEWNFNGNMPGVTKFVFEHLDVPVTFTGFEVGMQIKTGNVLNERDTLNPLYAGFKYFSEHAPWMKQYYKGKVSDNSSYDQTGVLYAVEGGLGNYWEKVSGGRCVPDSTGGNTWVSDPGSDHSYLVLKEDPEVMAAIIEKVMLGEF